MHDKLQNAFAIVRAEEALKAGTLAAVSRKARWHWVRPLVWAAACLLFLIGAGTGVFFTPVSAISIDVNPSLEFRVNRFDRVIGVEGYNEDGWELAQTPHLLFADYTQALDTLLSSARIQGYLEQGEALSIFVACDDEQRSSEMLARVESCAGHSRNVYCHMGGWDESAAHEAGLTCGKYQAFLELQALDPTVTPEDVQGLTMREIRERIAEITGTPAPSGHGNGHGNGYGYGQGNGFHHGWHHDE